MGNYVCSMAFPAPVPVPLPNSTRFCRTRTGKVIPIVYYPCQDSRFTVIVSHGNATDLSRQDEFLKEFSSRMRLSIVCYEYIGYGHSYDDNSKSMVRLQPSEKGCYESIDAAFEYITNILRVPTTQQIWLGYSIGSGPTVDLAARIGDNYNSIDGIAGVILVSSFTSATDVASPIVSLFYNMFANRHKINRIRSDILLLHGTNDELILFAHSQKLSEARKSVANTYKTYLKPIEWAAHNDIFCYEETWRTIQTFVKSLEQHQS